MILRLNGENAVAINLFGHFMSWYVPDQEEGRLYVGFLGGR